MNKSNRTLVVGLCLYFCSTISLSVYADEDAVSPDEEGFTALFDGKSLTGWTSARSKNEDQSGIFSVNEEEKAIHAYAGREAGSRQGTDCLVSEKEFSHFILKIEYKWLEKRFAPRPDWDRDAGLLYHVHGNLKKVWPLSLEMQIGESLADQPNGKREKLRSHTGDLYVLGKKLRTQTPFKDGFYSPDAPRQKEKRVFTNRGVEKPKGQWNQIELRVHGSEKATYLLNGEVVLETFDFIQEGKDGETTPLGKGHIGLQAEWAELLYRNIQIKELPIE